MEIKVIGKILKSNNRMFEGEGKIINSDGKVLATEKAVYAKIQLDNIVNSISNEEASQMMFMNYLDYEPEVIEY